MSELFCKIKVCFFIVFTSVSVCQVSALATEVQDEQKTASLGSFKLVSSITAPFDMPQIQPPVFANRVFDVRRFGGIADGNTLNSKAFADAIDTCAKSGGGTVLVSKGLWLTGPIHLKSNVNLHIAKGAELRFSTRFEDYLPVVFTRNEGIECYNYSPLIYANGCTNIAITGEGLLNGQGHVWWPWKNETRKPDARINWLRNAQYNGIPVEKRVFGTVKDALRPNFIQPINCKNVLIEGLTFTNSPMWNIHPVYCENVIVRKVTVITTAESPNTDGINPDSCKNVLIEDSYFDTGDDCIVLKSGKNEDGWRVGKPCENIVIRHCRTKHGHGGVVIGSEMSGEVRNVYIHDCYFDGTDVGIRMKSRRGRGGVVENIWVENITMGKIHSHAIRLNMFYGCGIEPRSRKPGIFRNMYFKNIFCRQTKEAIKIAGLPEKPIENINLENVVVYANKGALCSDAKNINFRNVTIAPSDGSVMRFKDCRDISIIDSHCPAYATTFVELKGGKTKNIHLKNNGLIDRQKQIKRDKNVAADAVNIKN
jgi:polygalacturonase